MSAAPDTTGSQQDEFAQRLAELRGQNGATNGKSPTSDTDGSSGERPGGSPVGTGDYTVRDGDCMSKIAKESGHFWQTLWDDGGNAELKSIRRQPNVLMPGDRVTVPPIRQKYEEGQSKMRHRFVRRGEPSHLVLRILDQDVPRANEPYKLIIDGDQEITGVTDAEGKLDVPIPGNANKGKLIVGEEPDVLEYDLDLGGLDPVETWKGVQTRLANLGIPCEVTGAQDEQTMDAVNEFRAQNGLPAVQDVDDATRQQLQDKHGS
jgi:N-acetylmuramoyl-L-alanine amidase